MEKTSLQLCHTYPTLANVFTNNHKAAQSKIENVLPSKTVLATLLIAVNFYLQISQIRPINMYLSCIHTIIVPGALLTEQKCTSYRPQYTILLLTCHNRKCLSHLQPSCRGLKSYLHHFYDSSEELVSHKTHLILEVRICSGLKQFLDCRMVTVDGGTDQSCVSML